MGLISASLRLLTGDVRALDVAINDANGNQLSGFDPSRPATATIATVAVSTTSAVLAAANAARRRLSVTNESNSTLYIAFAATATATAYTIPLAKGQTWEGVLNDYTGVVSGILAAGTGSARVTEVTT